MEERSDGILLRPVGEAPPKLSWADTAREMAAAAEDWSDWDATVADGLETAPWTPTSPRRVAAEPAPKGASRGRPRRR